MKQLLSELFQAHYRDIYTYFYGLCHDASLSEDLASDVFLEAVKSIATFRGESDIRTWLFSIARHRWYGYLRKKDRQVPTLSIHELYDTPELGTADKGPEADAARAVRDFLAGEPPLIRSVVKLRLEGYSYCEIAARQGISESSARVLFFRAKVRLRKHLKKEDFRYE